MIKVLIVDDEPKSCEILKLRLAKYSTKLSVIGVANEISTATKLINELSPDVIFLDIQMPGGSGFDLLKQFPEQDFLVVFVTAYNEYAIQALKLNALDYLLKPIDPDELNLTVDKIIHKLSSKEIREENINLLQVVKSQIDFSEGKVHKMIIPFINGFEVINIDDIVYFEADRNYTKIVFNNKSEKIISRTLKEFENLLSGLNFFRIHHSYLINLNHVIKYYKGKGGYVIMSNGQPLNVSRVKKEEFLKKFIGN